MVNAYGKITILLQADVCRLSATAFHEFWSVKAPGRGPSSIGLLGATLPLCRARVSPAKLFRPVELTRPPKSLLIPDHRHLGDVDRTSAKSALAIHEIVAPEVMERLGKIR